MTEYIVANAKPNQTVLKTFTRNGYEHEMWLPVREEIVRCRDCAFYAPDSDPIDPGWPMWCERHEIDMVRPDCFCAWGERRDA